MNEYLVAVPARYASSRLAGKPLASVGGRPMIEAVCTQVLKSSASKVIACVDDERISAALADLKQKTSRLEICMTSDKPRSGTERIAEMIKLKNLDPDTVIVNVQGDEPLICADHINAVADLLFRSGADMSTLCTPITEVKDVFDPNCVKAVLNERGEAMYFSRAPIPYERDVFKGEVKSMSDLSCSHLRHIGIYAYRAKTVLDYLQREPSAAETAESLEQLRLLHYGMRIAVAVTDTPPEAGVDTAEDLERVNRILQSRDH